MWSGRGQALDWKPHFEKQTRCTGNTGLEQYGVKEKMAVHPLLSFRSREQYHFSRSRVVTKQIAVLYGYSLTESSSKILYGWKKDRNKRNTVRNCNY